MSLNGIIKPSPLRHRNDESESNSNTTDEQSVKSEQAVVNEQSPPPYPSCKVDSNDAKPSLDRLESKMEISENGSLKVNEHSEYLRDGKSKFTEQCEEEIERNDGVSRAEPNVNGDVVKGEEERERVCEGEGEGEGEGELLAEEHMEVSGDEKCGNEAEEQGHPQECGYQPGFGKQRKSVVYTDLGSRRHTLCYCQHT